MYRYRSATVWSSTLFKALHRFFVSYWSNKTLISQRGSEVEQTRCNLRHLSGATTHPNAIQDQTTVTKAQPKTFVKTKNCSWGAKYCAVLQSRTPVWLGPLVLAAKSIFCQFGVEKTNSSRMTETKTARLYTLPAEKHGDVLSVTSPKRFSEEPFVKSSVASTAIAIFHLPDFGTWLQGFAPIQPQEQHWCWAIGSTAHEALKASHCPLEVWIFTGITIHVSAIRMQKHSSQCISVYGILSYLYFTANGDVFII